MVNLSIGPFLYSEVQPRSRKIAVGLDWLASRQDPSGHWGSAHPLDRVVSTCQATMTLFAAGFPSSDPVVARGLAYLCSDQVSRYQWGFWRCGPLLGVPGFEALVEEDLAELERRLARRAGPSADQPLQTFLARAYLRLDRHADARRHCEYLLEAFSHSDGWLSRADATSHALSVLTSCPGLEPPLDEGIVERSFELIRAKATRVGGHADQISWEGRAVSTSYVIMNLLEAGDLSRRPDVREMLDDAARYLESAQETEGWWPVEPTPYGGDLEITEPDYYSAVALRGLLGYAYAFDGPAALEVTHHMITVRRNQLEVAAGDSAAASAAAERAQMGQRSAERRVRWGVTGCGILLFLLVLPSLLQAIPGVAEELRLIDDPEADARLARVGSWASVIGVAIAVTSGVAALVRWYRHRHRQPPTD